MFSSFVNENFSQQVFNGQQADEMAIFFDPYDSRSGQEELALLLRWHERKLP